MGFVDFIVTFITFNVTLLISLAILVPFIGVVVRYRANYNPRALNLSEEDARVAPRISSLLSMFLRTRRIEGWQGLWKGFSECRAHSCPFCANYLDADWGFAVPSLLYSLFNTFTAILWLGASGNRPKGQYSIPEASAFRALIYGLVMSFLSIPFTIIINR
jgi:hypothetical protein